MVETSFDKTIRSFFTKPKKSCLGAFFEVTVVEHQKQRLVRMIRNVFLKLDKYELDELEASKEYYDRFFSFHDLPCPRTNAVFVSPHVRDILKSRMPIAVKNYMRGALRYR